MIECRVTGGLEVSAVLLGWPCRPKGHCYFSLWLAALNKINFGAPFHKGATLRVEDCLLESFVFNLLVRTPPSFLARKSAVPTSTVAPVVPWSSSGTQSFLMCSVNLPQGPLQDWGRNRVCEALGLSK